MSEYLPQSTLMPMLRPNNEVERLAALQRYNILDTPPEAAFDRITTLASRLFDVSIALVSLVDESRTWVKSSSAFVLPDITRDDTICSSAVLSDDVLIVLDTQKDQRFALNPFVQGEPGVRFYAGAPLLTHDGFNIGMLCLLDYQPRENFSQDQQETLVALAAMVVDELELRLAAEKMALLDQALVQVTQELAPTTGEEFFASLVLQFTQALEVNCAYIALLEEDRAMLKTISASVAGKLVNNFEYALRDTPCAQVIQKRKICCYPCKLQVEFPQAPLLGVMGIESYMAVPFFDSRGTLLGLLGVMDVKPLKNVQLAESLLTIFALRITAELERQRSEENRAEMLRQEQRLHQAEQQARIEAESANRLKDEFLATLSHELRTPLNPILGWSKILQGKSIDQATLIRGLQTIERNAQLQTQLVSDLLDVSRILQGKMLLNIAIVDLRETVNAALETTHLAAQAKSLQIKTELDIPICLVSGDANRLQQVIWNLLANAVKFTNQGDQILVRLSRIQDYAQIQVSDTGRGIIAEFLPYVFESFRQADNTITRQFGGLGLGLAITKQIVELHGGTVIAESLGENQGATFTVRLPLLKVEEQATDDDHQLPVSDGLPPHLAHTNSLPIVPDHQAPYPLELSPFQSDP